TCALTTRPTRRCSDLMLGLYPRVAHVVMLGLVTLAVVASFRTVGSLLVFGLLVAPPATASLLVRRVPAMMAVGACLGIASVAVRSEEHTSELQSRENL